MNASTVLKRAKEMWDSNGRPTQLEWYIAKAGNELHDDEAKRDAQIFYAHAEQIQAERIERAIALAEASER
jgi:hypothetical protein